MIGLYSSITNERWVTWDRPYKMGRPGSSNRGRNAGKGWLGKTSVPRFPEGLSRLPCQGENRSRFGSLRAARRAAPDFGELCLTRGNHDDSGRAHSSSVGRRGATHDALRIRASEKSPREGPSEQFAFEATYWNHGQTLSL